VKALILKEAGVDPAFDLVEIDDPSVSEDGVVLEVEAVGVCHHDISVMDGTLRRGVKDDVILGHEIAGTVVDVGPSTQGIKLGDKAVTTLTTSCGLCETCLGGLEYRCPQAHGLGHGIDGGFAEYISVRRNNLVKLEDHMDLIGASLIACPIGVTVRALEDLCEVSAGQSVVVFGSGGGLGVHAAQVASSLGAEVIAFTRSPNKIQRLQELGFGQVFLLEEGLDPSDLVYALTQDLGADIAFNPVGSAVFEAALRCLGNGGKMVVLGEVEGNHSSVNIAELIFRDGSVIGSSGAGIRHIESACEQVSSGIITPVVEARMPFEEIVQAYKLIKSGDVFGRIVLTPAGKPT